MPPSSNQRQADRRDIPPVKRIKRTTRAIESFFRSIEPDDDDDDEVMIVNAPPSIARSAVISDDDFEDDKPIVKKFIKRKVESDDDFTSTPTRTSCSVVVSDDFEDDKPIVKKSVKINKSVKRKIGSDDDEVNEIQTKSRKSFKQSVKSQPKKSIVQTGSQLTNTRSRRAPLNMFIQWHLSEYQDVIERSEILGLKECLRCGVVSSSANAHNCKPKSRLSLRNKLNQYLNELSQQLDGDERFQDTGKIDESVVDMDEEDYLVLDEARSNLEDVVRASLDSALDPNIDPSHLTTKTSVVKRCLSNILNDQYRELFMNKINQLVIDNQQALILATRLINLHLLRVAASSNFESFEFGQQVIKSAIVLVSNFESGPTEHLKKVKTKSEDVLSLEHTFLKHFKPCLGNDFILPSGDQLTSTSQQTASKMLVTNFENYYQTTFWIRLKKWIKMHLDDNIKSLKGWPYGKNDKQKKHIKWFQSKVMSLIYSHLIRSLDPQPSDFHFQLNELLVAFGDKCNDEENDSINEFVSYARDFYERIDPEFRLNYVRFLKDQKLEKNNLSSERFLLPWMHRMLVEFEFDNAKGEKGALYKDINYSLFPIARWIPSHIELTQYLMVMIWEDVTGCKRINKEDISWQRDLFKTSHDITKLWKGWTRCLTDGVSICFSRELVIPKVIQPSTKDKITIDEIKQSKQSLLQTVIQSNPNTPIRLISIDTNRRNFFVACERILDPTQSDPIHQYDKKYEISNAEWKTERGLKQATKQRETRMKSNPSIQPILNEPAMSCKGSSTTAMTNHIKHIVKHWSILCSFYFKRWYRRSRMVLYSKSQGAWDYILEKFNVRKRWGNTKRNRKSKSYRRRVIRKTIEQSKSNTIVILGDGAFDTTSPGHEPLPSARKLYGELKKRGVHVIWQDEFRTSKLCSNCHSCVKEFKTTSFCYPPYKRAQPPTQSSNLPYIKPKRVKSFQADATPWGIRLCPNKECSILWNRDMNACVNMLDLFLFDCDQPISHDHMTKFNRDTPAEEVQSDSDSDVSTTI